MNIVETVTRFGRSLTEEQREDLWVLVRECKKLGATNSQLAPIIATNVDFDVKLNPEEMKIGLQLEEKAKELLNECR